MQKRDSAFAIGMGLPVQPGQVPAQFVVQALNVMRVCLANRVLVSRQDAFVGLVVVCAVFDMRRLWQLLGKHLRCGAASLAQGKCHYLVAAPVDGPPQPQGLFFEPT